MNSGCTAEFRVLHNCRFGRLRVIRDISGTRPEGPFLSWYPNAGAVCQPTLSAIANIGQEEAAAL